MYIERDLEKEILKWIDSPEILAIRGPRQSGKTTLLQRLQEKLGKIHTPEKIHFVSFENDLERIRFEEAPLQFMEYYLHEKKHFFLLDEVQYVQNAGRLLKLIVDTHKDIKIIITGSSTLDLNKIGSALVGRVLFFELRPFSFSEYLRSRDPRLFAHYTTYKISLKKPILKKSVYVPELNRHLREYLLYGGYPRVVLEKSIEKKKFLLKNLFTTYIEKDVISLYGIKYKEKMIVALKYLAAITGNMLKYETLSGISGLYHQELKEVLSILENTYVIKLVKPFHKNMVTELKKNPKVYFIDPGLRNILLDRFEFSDEEFGHLLENYVLNVVKEAKFWRTTAKAEIDFVLQEQIPVEVKMTPEISGGFRSFLEQYGPGKGFIVTWDIFDKRIVNEQQVYFLPACVIGE